MHITHYKDIEFVGTKDQHAALHEWYDGLLDSEVKTSILKLSCRESGLPQPSLLHVVVVCNHPFTDKTWILDRARKSGNEADVDRALGVLMEIFNEWVSASAMPDELLLNDRQACVKWQPVETFPSGPGRLSWQEQAQAEMNCHALDCLELIRIATATDDQFLRLWKDSNDPFLAAGRLAFGQFEWIRHFPDPLICNEAQRVSLLERTSEFAREYLGLVRFALLSGHESPLAWNISLLMARFQRRYRLDLPHWRQLAEQHLDSERDSGEPSVLPSQIYTDIDGACDLLRNDLLAATDGFEDCLPSLVNSFLPGLKPPESALLFTDGLDSWMEFGQDSFEIPA